MYVLYMYVNADKNEQTTLLNYPINIIKIEKIMQLIFSNNRSDRLIAYLIVLLFAEFPNVR